MSKYYKPVSEEQKAKTLAAKIERLKPMQFKPGNKMSKGRKKGTHIVSNHLEKFLKRIIKVNVSVDGGKKIVEDRTYAEAIALKIIQQALQGNTKAQTLLLDRTEGKALQRTEISGIDGESIKIEQPLQLDLDKLSLKELKMLEKTIEKKSIENNTDENSNSE